MRAIACALALVACGAQARAQDGSGSLDAPASSAELGSEWDAAPGTEAVRNPIIGSGFDDGWLYTGVSFALTWWAASVAMIIPEIALPRPSCSNDRCGWERSHRCRSRALGDRLSRW